MRANCHALIALTALLAASSAAGAGDAAVYPSRPVRLIVPYSPGGTSEVAARAVADALAKAIGQPVLVENKPGAEGALAAQAAFMAPPDGHTLLLGACSVLPQAASATAVPPDAPIYFTAVSTIGDLTYGLYVHPGVPARSPAELIAHARANAGQLNYATVTLTMEAAMARLFGSTDVPMTQVPYKGGAQAVTDLIGGRVHVFFGPIGNGLAQAREGQLRLLASHPRRSPLAPDTPTLAEAGIPLAGLPLTLTVCVDPRTPHAIVGRLSLEINGVLNDTRLRASLEKLALTVRGSTPEQAAAELRAGAVTMITFASGRKLR